MSLYAGGALFQSGERPGQWAYCVVVHITNKMSVALISLSFFVDSQKLLLVKIAFDGNNKIKQRCVMDERECIRIAECANIRFESVIDIFYDKHFEFEKYESNIEAANHLKEFYPKKWRFFQKHMH